MGKISELDPNCVFERFEDITKIPRTSGNEKQISDYLVDFAGKRGFIAYQDKLNNVTILKPATAGMEDKDTVILQAHLDMVGAAQDGKSFDFAKDSVEAYIDGDYIKANGTTLGADNGIGIAMILAILDSDNISHPMIEAVFTVSEEVGLVGAAEYDYSKLSGRKMINLDTEEENHIVVGCAGGCTCTLSGKCKKEKNEGVVYDIIISNLAGGHSGCEIDKDRANANVLMGRILNEALKSCEMSLVSLEGGTLDNAICNHCKATVVVRKKTTKEFEKSVDTLKEELKREYKKSEPEMKIKVKEKGKEKLETVSGNDLNRIIGILVLAPNGVHRYSQELDDMVSCSANVGIVRVKPKQYSVCVSLRGNLNSQLEEQKNKVDALAKAFEANLVINGCYPAWESDNTSDFALKVKEVYQKKFNKDIEIVSIHAGLECAQFSNHIKGLDVISIGPNMEGVHTPNEKLDISSVKREWELLKEILKL